MKYFYAIGDKKHGPFSLIDFKEKSIPKGCLVWKEGMENWVEANQLEELTGFLEIEPPPLPKTKPKPLTVKNIPISKYDDSYKLEIHQTIAGVIIIVVSFLLAAMVGSSTNLQDFRTNKNVALIVGLAIRIISTIWVVGSAKRQNRNASSWGLFAFFIPSIALIIIGLTRKIRIDPIYPKPQLNKKTHNVDNNLLFNAWKKANPKKTMEDFYKELDEENEEDESNKS